MTTSKPVLILQLRPEDETSDGEFYAILKYGNLNESAVHRIRIEKSGFPVLDLDNYCAVIVGGSPFDISVPENEKSCIQKDIEQGFRLLFDEIVPRDFPFLGACSGNGLLGSYLGAEITGKYSEPVGGATVELTTEGKQDYLLAGFPDKIRVLLGHKEACDSIPPGATLLIRGDACAVQMFRCGNNVYATQFHPEGDAKGFEIRINAYRNHGYFDSNHVEELVSVINKEETPYAQAILKRFVERYVRS